MLVRFLGFHISTPNSLPLAELIHYLSKETTSFPGIDEPGRFLFVDANADEGYYLGLIVTVKNQRTFCELRESGESFKVVVNNLNENSNIMEFNFFLINKKSGVGLYQHYHQSCSLGQAMSLLKKTFNKLKDEKKSSMTQDLVSKGKTEKTAKSSASKHYKGFLTWEILVMKDNLGEVLEELERIKSLELDFSYLEPDSKEFSQLSGFVRKQRKKFSFSKANVSSIAKAIVETVKNSDANSGRVYAVDDEGLERVIKIQNNPDNFGEIDYDEVAKHIHELEVKSFKNSWVVKELKRRCEERPEIFKAKIK